MQYHLRQALTSIEAQILIRPEVFVTFAAKKFDDKTLELTDHRPKTWSSCSSKLTRNSWAAAPPSTDTNGNNSSVILEARAKRASKGGATDDSRPSFEARASARAPQDDGHYLRCWYETMARLVGRVGHDASCAKCHNTPE